MHKKYGHFFESDLENALAYSCDVFGKDLTRAFSKAIQIKISIIKNFPNIGVCVDVELQIYKSKISKYPYSLFYNIDQGNIKFLRFIHDKMDF